ncbi:hypothetical protein ENUP19_0110G0003 [Entamoeba nuttalli]
MKRFTNVVRKNENSSQQQQPQLAFVSTDISNNETQNNSFIFWEIARMYDFYLLRLLIRHSSATVTEFWDSIRDLLEESGQIYRILSEELQYEISNTSEEQFLLRSNSGATHLLSSVMRRDLTSLLEKHMNPIIQSVNHITDQISLDSKDDNYTKSITTLSELLHLHCSRFLSLGNDFPQGIKYILATLRNAVSEKFPDSAIRSIAIIIFHRLITPALVSPANYNSCLIEPTENAKKILVILTKIYQSFIPQGETPLTNPQLIPFNTYVVSMYESMNKFLDSISIETEFPHLHRAPILSKDVLDHCYKNISDVINSMTSVVLSNLVSRATDDNRLILLENFFALICTSWDKEPLNKLIKPKTLQLFNDETDESYLKVAEGFKQTILKRIKKIDELNDEIFFLRNQIEEYCISKGLDFEKFIEDYNPFKPLPPPCYTRERCGLGLLETEESNEIDCSKDVRSSLSSSILSNEESASILSDRTMKNEITESSYQGEMSQTE